MPERRSLARKRISLEDIFDDKIIMWGFILPDDKLSLWLTLEGFPTPEGGVKGSQ
jgi:hypothetical protein